MESIDLYMLLWLKINDLNPENYFDSNIVHLFTAHSVNFFEFQIIVIYLLINKQIEHLFGV
jgi:hypothetical protein